MKKQLYILLFILFSGALLFTGAVYHAYYQDEKKIASTLLFRETAWSAFQALGHGRIDEAIILYEQALQIHREDAKTMGDYALALTKTGRLVEAADYFLKAYLLDPGKGEKNLTSAGVLYMQVGRYEEAMAVYKTLLRVHKRLYRYVDQIALVAFRTGDKEKALAYYAYIYEKKPDWFAGKDEFLELTALYQTRKDEVVAIDLQEVHERSSEIEELKKAAEELVGKHWYKQAVFTYQRILELEADNDEIRKKTARLFLNHGNHFSALELLESVQEKDFDTWFTIGGIHHEARRYKLALESYEQALAIKTDVQLLLNMSSCAFYLNDKEALARYFTKLERKDPLVAYKFKHAVAINQGLEEGKKDRLIHHAKLLWYSMVGKGRNLFR